MKEQDLREKFEGAIGLTLDSLTDQCVQIAKDYAKEEAIEFTEWLILKCDYSKHGAWNYQGMEFTQKELYQLYLTTKTK